MCCNYYRSAKIPLTRKPPWYNVALKRSNYSKSFFVMPKLCRFGKYLRGQITLIETEPCRKSSQPTYKQHIHHEVKGAAAEIQHCTERSNASMKEQHHSYTVFSSLRTFNSIQVRKKVKEFSSIEANDKIIPLQSSIPVFKRCAGCA